ncbi:MAG: peptidoglycan-binding domain-containing protein [Candidatus Staskawiczbacteria bacterium]|nr:peptidoglycan-binding domain-containing protein [Candidatus Staskawiczbacteria bacterium]
MNTKIKTIVVTSAIAVASLLMSAGLVSASNGYFTVSANTPLIVHMGVGSTGSDVSKLQIFLASNSDIYPSGRVTGYYGPLTEAAVQQYQLSYGIQTLGNVGPATFASINNTMARQYGIDVYGPTIYDTSVQTFSNSATINWTATGYASGVVFYSTYPFSVTEAVGNFSNPTILGGLNVSTAYAANAQSVTLGNLQTNTTYYYIIRATDASGNVSVTQQLSFITR